MALPTVSACVAVYNGENSLARALDSILKQTRPADEIIVLDDGSSDGTAALARAYPQTRFVQQANGGIGAARNRLLEEAQGDWIAFCDHDDWWEPNRIADQMSFMGDPEVVLAYGPVWHHDELGNSVAPGLRTAPDRPSIDHVVPHPEDIWTSSTLLRRQSVMAAGNFNPSFRTGEDMLMWFQLAGRGKIVQGSQRNVHMSRRSDSTSAASKSQFEYSSRLYLEQVLPHFDVWFAALSAIDRRPYYKMLEAKAGYILSILAAYYDAEGDHRAALELYRQAVKMAPKSRGAWYRYLRSQIGIPAKPPC